MMNFATKTRTGTLAAIASACGLTCGLLMAPALAAGAAGSPAPPAKISAAPHPSSLDRRVSLLTAELDLDAHQQSEVRRILEGQRDAVLKVWNDNSTPAANRVNATKTISERTADQIRA